MTSSRTTHSGRTFVLVVSLLQTMVFARASHADTPRPDAQLKVAGEMPAASSYGPRVPRRLLCDPTAWPRPVDGALCDAAHLLARLATQTDLADAAHRQDLLARWAPFLGQRQGVPDPRVRVTLVTDARFGVVHAKLEASARALPAEQRLGVGIAAGPAGAVGVLLSVDDALLPAPFPRHPPRGHDLVLSFTLSHEARATRALLEWPSGETHDLALDRRTGSLSLRVPALEQQGVYQLQILIDRGRGPEIGLLAPLYVDSTEPSRPPPLPQPPRSTAENSTDRAHGLLRALRAKKARAPLRRDPALDRIAHLRATTMARERAVVHEAREGENAARLLREARFRHHFIAEDLALGPDVEQAFQSLLRSPAHRAALLDPRPNRVGVGTVQTDDGLYLAVLLAGVREASHFTPLARELDRQRALLDLFEGITRRRREARLPAAHRDPDLDPVAQHLADRLAAAGATRDPDASATVSALLADRDPPARGAFLDMVVAPQVGDAAEAPASVDPACRVIGLGAARGERNGLEQAFVVILCLPR